MQVKELIEKLKNMPEDAHVVIDNRVAHDIELKTGKLLLGYSKVYL